jgi:hypothetical protein
MAGLDPAIPINSRGHAFLSEIVGTSPAMTIYFLAPGSRESFFISNSSR